MADQPIHEPLDYSTVLRLLQGSDLVNDDTFNPLFERLINNDVYLKNQVDKPFNLISVTYDAVNDRIVCTWGAGIAELFNGSARVTVEINEGVVYYIPAPAINTTYYLYLQADGTFTNNTTGTVPAGAVLLWEVATGATVDVLTKTDRRAQISGAAAKLAAHLEDNAPHGLYEVSKSNKDANGIFQAVTYTRNSDGTTYRIDTLSNPDADGNYQTLTSEYYDTDGMTLLETWIWTLVYDADGDITDKTVVVS